MRADYRSCHAWHPFSFPANKISLFLRLSSLLTRELLLVLLASVLLASFASFAPCRLVCGQCLDFKLQITMPLDDYGPWSEKDHSPESDFLAALKGIDGVSQVETQTITNMII